MPEVEYDVGIVGGGIAGLTLATLLSKEGLKVVLFESKSYPRHKVCGEYVSNEIRPFLERHGLFPDTKLPAEISRFELTDTSGRSSINQLDMGGFGISRFHWDHHLYKAALTAGTEIFTDRRIKNVAFHDDLFQVTASGKKSCTVKVLVGAHGKRSVFDKKLDRGFLKKRHPYVGVKYHAKGDFPTDLVALHNFNGGYCGVNAVEDGLTNVCYLSHRDNFRKYGSIEQVHEQVLNRNPALAEVLKGLAPQFEKPLVINEISFDTKEPVDAHVLMCGDAAGMITPLCGNGMAMAVRSARLLSECILDNWVHFSREKLEMTYQNKWNDIFKRRLAIGRNVQKLFGSDGMSRLAVGLAKNSSFITSRLISLTHGSVMD